MVNDRLMSLVSCLSGPAWLRLVPMTNYFSYIADNGSWITYFIALPLPANLNINISQYHIPSSLIRHLQSLLLSQKLNRILSKRPGIKVLGYLSITLSMFRKRKTSIKQRNFEKLLKLPRNISLGDYKSGKARKLFFKNLHICIRNYSTQIFEK